MPHQPGRRRFTAGAASLLAGTGAWSATGAQTGPEGKATNVLRVLLPAAETGFDPAATGDLYSNRIASHIFEALLDYDPLAVPVRLVPRTAAALPEVAADFRTWTVRLKRGTLFAADAAFKGQPRELVAADYVFSFKRIFDPATKSPFFSLLNEDGIIGLAALREKAVRDKTPFDYASEVEGVRALDRYTLQFKLAAPRPRFATTLASVNYAAVAREVVLAYGADLSAHPVGTGPYRLKSWRRSSQIVLEKNPTFRDERYQSEPAADDAQGQAWAKRFNGRRLPLNDGVEISVIEEGQPRWLSFLNGQADLATVPSELVALAAPNGRLAPNLAKQGIALNRTLNADIAMSYFNMEDPVVGGYTADKVALRRAIQLAYDIEKEVRIIRRGEAIPAQAFMAPGTYGYDPAYRTANSSHDTARAQALLDIYGYLDRDGDGWRERPDGSPLLLTMATETSQIDRQYNENWQKSLAAIGVRIRFDAGQWPEHYKASRAGKLQMWFLGDTATKPDGQGMLEFLYSESIGESNLARFRRPEFDAVYRRMLDLPDGPERAELFKKASEIGIAYMPYRVHCHRFAADFTHPWITGYRRPVFREQIWQYVDVDGERRAKSLA